ncbi:helix-turn-helix transcriptional regulator, partial [Mycobacterium tuberculosis]
MKKYESLYKIMSYAYHHDRFTLRDLMTEFSISKSTALRYVKSLEDIGVPLYSEPGRYGGYKIMDTYAVPPITLTPQETYALFFALKTIESLGAMPFKAEYNAIRQKFIQS